MQEADTNTIIWHKVSAQGLWDRINTEILRPTLGVEVFEYPEEGLVADNGVWEYSPELTQWLLNNEEIVDSVHQLLSKEGYIENFNS